MKNNKALIISIIIFMVTACVALGLVLSKGHIGDYALVDDGTVAENDDEKIKPQMTLEIDKKILASNNKKEKASLTAKMNGEILMEGVTFESLNEEVVKIEENNTVVPVKDGKTQIKAVFDGIEATCDVKVITPIKSMTFTSTNSTIRVGKDLQMKLKTTPSTASTDTLVYTSSDNEIATVNSNGIVTGVKPGKVTITIKDTFTGIEKQVKLSIRK